MLGCAYLHTHTEFSASPAATHGPLAPSHRMACTRIGLLLKKKKTLDITTVGILYTSRFCSLRRVPTQIS
jgi:hypothetical protein